MLRGDVSASEDEEEEPLLVLKKDFISGEELAGGDAWNTRPCSDGRRSRPEEEVPARSSAIAMRIAVASPESDGMGRNGVLGCVNGREMVVTSLNGTIYYTRNQYV